MNTRTISISAFIFGAIIGSITTWAISKQKHEQEINSVKAVFRKKYNPEHDHKQQEQEINSVKAGFRKKYNPEHDHKQQEPATETSGYVGTPVRPSEDLNNVITRYSGKKPNLSDYAAKLEAEEDENETHGEFELLSPDEFGENEDEYPVISLKYYADQALADENDHLVRNSESLIGTDALNHFGDFEDDAVYVRNNRLKCEYEILLDQRKYADVLKKKPYITED